MKKKENLTLRTQSGETIYTQSVVLEMTQVSLDFLRECEIEGLIQRRKIDDYPGYSAADIRRLARIRRLREDLELDLPAVEVVLHLRQQVSHLLSELDQIEQQMRRREQELLQELQDLRRRLAVEARWE